MEETDRVVAKMTNSLKRQNELNRRNSLVAKLINVMRYNGASERSIKKALPAIQEFAQYSERLPGYLPLDKSEEPEHPAQTAPSDTQADKPEHGNDSASHGTGQKVA